jgi:5'-methylthioadenosine phosphorylase
MIGVIGGSGLYAIPSLKKKKEIRVKTPFGDPSGPLMTGELGATPCVFLPRHGHGHVLLPSELPARANIWALKSLGVTRILAVSAVGSLRAELPPRTFVFPDQIIDRTKGRVSTFFGEGIVGHVAFDKPFCPDVSRALYANASSLGISSRAGGIYVCMEGPQYSTRAESELHRQMGASLIGMTACPEAKLAREAELCYAMAALVTDYDCWKAGEEVSSHQVLETMKSNVADAHRMLAAAIPAIAKLPRDCKCGQALEGSIFTPPALMNKATAKKLELIIGHRVRKKK